MKNRNIYWIIAGILNLLTFFLHLIGGQVDLVNPMMETSLELEKGTQLIGAWHMVTVILLATSIVLLMAGFGKRYSSSLDMIRFVGILNLAFCAPFIITSFYYGLLVPQWIFFLPIALFTKLGLNKATTIS